MPRLLGVLGGMGPLATVDFLQKLIEVTPAKVDQDHVPVIVYGVPQIPPRVPAIMGGGESPLPALLAGVETLRRAGAEAIAMPCNTAHFWYEAMQWEAGIPILHIVDACRDELPKGNAPVGLLGTEAALAARIYQDRLAEQGLEFLINAPERRAEWVVPAIALVKQGRLEGAGRLAERAVAELVGQGAERVILACTELPPALAAIKSPYLVNTIDPTLALAKASSAWSLGLDVAGTQRLAGE
ncbi:MAG TPA: amino acid racemase [Aliidongia sp.]|nr:amino acid racemase [Aliidongia sp.]